MDNMTNIKLILLIRMSVFITNIFGVRTEKFEKDFIIVNVLCDSFDFGQARSATECAGYCDHVPSCRSFFYVKHEQLCKGSTTIHGSDGGCSVKTGALYYKPTGTTTTTTTTISSTTTTLTTTTTTSLAVSYGSNCSTDAECTLIFTFCLQNTCQCMAGYSLNPASGGCVTSCSLYANEYILHPDMAFDVPHIAQYSDVSLADCKLYCSNSATLCLGFNYCEMCGNLCRLKSGSPLTNPGNYYSMSSVDYYFRNCQ